MVILMFGFRSLGVKVTSSGVEGFGLRRKGYEFRR